MADSSLDNLAMGGDLSGGPLDLGSFTGGGSSGSGFNLSGGDIGALGLGALGFAAILGQGESPLPTEFTSLQQSVPTLQSQGSQAFGLGTGLVNQGQSALAMAQRGELTPEQQAQLKEYSTGLTSQARQQFYNMGRNPDADTGFLTQTANIDTQVNAMAQQQIQSTIQLGLGEISGGSGLMGQGLGFESAANQALIAAGDAQLKQDQNYSDSLTNAFGSIAKVFGAVLA